MSSGAPAPPRLVMQAPHNPSVNIMPNPDFLISGTCTGSSGSYTCENPCLNADLTWPTFSNVPACTAYALAAINNARAMENVAPMILPSNWDSLSVPEQMLVVTDLERVARGYPPFLGLNAALDREATSAASTNEDPALARGFATGYDALGLSAFGGSWVGGWNVLVGDYVMFYSDGWGGVTGTANVACVSPSSFGCWAHRDELLGNAPHFNDGVGLWCATCEMGAGYAVVKGNSSYTQLIELPAGRPPSMVFTWQRELPYFPAGAIGGVKTVSLARAAFQNSSLKLVWSVGGAQNVSLAVIYTFAGSSCSHVGRVVSFRYVPTFNIRRSTVTISGSATFLPRVRYSAVAQIYTPGGTFTTDCVSLGIK
ncbi:MAG: hypothetical protein ABSG09_06085 [Acidimicrobiales bacterium]